MRLVTPGVVGMVSVFLGWRKICEKYQLVDTWNQILPSSSGSPLELFHQGKLVAHTKKTNIHLFTDDLL